MDAVYKSPRGKSVPLKQELSMYFAGSAGFPAALMSAP
jgi:hypothetical protein